jgi:hypothetical protein
MFTTKHFFKKQFTKILLACLCGCFSSSIYAAPQAIANKKDLKIALKTAKTLEDHQRIAAYYQGQAQKLQEKEKEEQGLADYFLAHPSMYGKIYPTPYQNHKGQAEYYRQAASEASEKAEQQQKMAKEVQSATPR